MADEDIQDTATPRSESQSSDDDSDEGQVELLVTGRERRKTAGNRYNRDAALEEAAEGEDEDEVALLFADLEGHEDEEFKSDVSDEDDMSSSDDDDQGPNAGPDDLEGEKDLQKQAKDDRAKKRKADLALTTTAGLRKRPKIDPTALKTAPKKPSKKKERVSWMPDSDNANSRSSLRKQTIAHREHTIARLKESEAQSKKYKALKEKRDREKAKDAPKAMTQADRLAEAERTERRNARSLNRWEAMEKKRNEEQAAKLAALKNRKLEGPVISWRSGKEHFRGPKHPLAIPKMEILIEEGPKKRGRKSKAYHEQMANMREAVAHNMIMGFPPPGQSLPLQFHQQLPPMQQSVQQSPQTWLGPPPPPPPPSIHYPTAQQMPAQPGAMHAPVADSTPTQQQQVQVVRDTQSQQPPSVLSTQTASSVQPSSEDGRPANTQQPLQPPTQEGSQPTPVADNSLLHGIHEYASMQPDSSKANDNDSSLPKPTEPIAAGEDEAQADPAQFHAVSATTIKAEGHQRQPNIPTSEGSKAPEEQPEVTQQTSSALSRPHTPIGLPPPPAVLGPYPPHSSPSVGITPPVQSLQDTPNTPAPPTPEVPMEEGFMTKNLLILDNFDELSSRDRQAYGVFFNTKKSAKPSKHGMTLCPITLMPAKYRDPATGIGYANLHAYKVLQELKEHKFVWSSMLGCYVGRNGAPVARGCPEGFLAT